MLTWEEIKKMDRAAIEKKVGELKKEYFEKKQKLLRGEQKDISEFKKLKKTVARLLTFAAALPPMEIKKIEATVTQTEEKGKKSKPAKEPKPETKKTEKKAVKKTEKKIVKKEKRK
ncbi:50S ribosomal protein L29P [Candidatus Termititenax aidoneus]|uniref:Large ribosomal subunit protein uL29 n=1 Tax=Termititenax aidoneus TaxID=2218524 RepID=A0A388TBW4_TERA1|nr:50S ribosomal protein L29P [Candidatus Termititenax aidoneus]